jgi:hypothetical protein
MMLRSSVSMVLGVVMAIPVPHRLQRSMTHIRQRKSAEQPTRRHQ